MINLLHDMLNAQETPTMWAEFNKNIIEATNATIYQNRAAVCCDFDRVTQTGDEN